MSELVVAAFNRQAEAEFPKKKEGKNPLLYNVPNPNNEFYCEWQAVHNADAALDILRNGAFVALSWA